MSPQECTLVEPLLGAYFDGELAGETAARIASHVAECPRCCESLQQVARADSLVRAAGPREPPQEVWDAMEVRLHAWARRQRYRRVVRRAAVAAACVLLLAGFGYLSGLFSSPPACLVPPQTGISARNQGPEGPPLHITVERGE